MPYVIMREWLNPRKMANICRMNPLAIACLGLFISISFNIFAIYALQHSPGAYDSAFVIDDSHFSRC
jgi:hypothetical protein